MSEKHAQKGCAQATLADVSQLVASLQFEATTVSMGWGFGSRGRHPDRNFWFAPIRTVGATHTPTPPPLAPLIFWVGGDSAPFRFFSLDEMACTTLRRNNLREG